MPTFELSGPDGGTYQIEADTAAGAVGAISSMFKAPETGIGEDLASVAKAAPGRAVAGIAGIPGDLYHLGLRALGDKLTPESAYGSNAIAKALGSDYRAKTETGRVGQKVLDFAPALIGGPETLAVKALTRVAAPVAASEAGRAIGGPVGEVAGALLGAGGGIAAARRAETAAAANAANNAIPTGEQLLQRGREQFNQARNMNLVVRPDFTTQTAADMRGALRGFDPEQTRPVFGAIDRLEGLGAAPHGLPPPAVEMNEVNFIREQLSGLRTSQDARTREAAREALNILTRNQQNLTAANTLAGDANAYSRTMREAVGNYGAGRRSQIVTGKQDLAELNAGTAGSGANEDNALRQAMKQLARPINNTNVPVARRLGFNENETEAIRNAATGTRLGNAARYLGKLAPTGSVSGVLSGGAGFAAAGPLGAVALPAAGYLAKRIGDLSTRRAVDAVDSLVRSRSPLAAQVVAQLPPRIVAQLPRRTQLLLGGAAIQPLAIQQTTNQRGY